MIRVQLARGVEARLEDGDWTVRARPGLGEVYRRLLERASALALLDYSPADGEPEAVIAAALERDLLVRSVSLTLPRRPRDRDY